MCASTCQSRHKENTMRLHVFAALSCAVLGACTSEPVPTPRQPAAAPVPVAAVTPPPSLESMRQALPAFDLKAVEPTHTTQREVSVVRDLPFPAEGSILTRDQVDLLAPLLLYLRANPDVAVRVEAYGDGNSSAMQETSLARDRAQAIVRALLTDVRVSNTITGGEAAGPHLGAYRSTGKITFVIP